RDLVARGRRVDELRDRDRTPPGGGPRRPARVQQHADACREVGDGVGAGAPLLEAVEGAGGDRLRELPAPDEAEQDEAATNDDEDDGDAAWRWLFLCRLCAFCLVHLPSVTAAANAAAPMPAALPVAHPQRKL